MSGDHDGLGSVLARHYTAVATFLSLSVASLVVVVGHPLVAVVPLGGLVVALALSTPIRRALDPAAGQPPDPQTARALEELRREYADGRVDAEEYQRRYDALVDGSGPSDGDDDP